MVRSTLLFFLAAFALPGATADEFFRSILSDDIATLKTLTASGPNVADARGTTPLHYAAAYGSTSAVRVLLDGGATVNARNAMEATPLFLAAPSPEKVAVLLAKGADPNAATKSGRTPLMIAAATPGGGPAVRQLLDAGADLHATDGQGTNAFNLAAAYSDLDTVKMLLARGAKVEVVDKAGFNALIGATMSKDVQRLRLLLDKGANVNAANTFAGKVRFGEIALTSMTPLIFAAPHSSVDVVRELLARGANVNAQDKRGQTPLMAAVSSDNHDMQVIQALLRAGADVNAKDPAGSTVLDWARKAGNPAVIKALEAKGAKGSAFAAAPVRKGAPVEVVEAVHQAVGLLNRSGSEFFKQAGCMGCHHQPMVARANAAVAKAGRTQGNGFRQEMQQVMSATRPLEPALLQFMDTGGETDSVSQALVGFAAAGVEPNSFTNAAVNYVATKQQFNGSWALQGIARPPFEESDITRTAFAIRAIRAYGWPARKAEFDARVAKAKAWLLKSEPRTSYERADVLLGLHWAGASAAETARFAAGLLREQRTDGGWSQNRYLSSDAYATGLALHALTESGHLRTADAAFTRAKSYLLKTQLDDGSWYVRSRAPKFQPYFQSGFPHDHDQWISVAATAYAVMGLAPSVQAPIATASR